MPGKKMVIFILTLILLLGVSLNFATFMQAESYPDPVSQTPSILIQNKDTALNAMLANFEHYSSFLNDVKVKQGYLIPSHGQTREEAIRYLCFAFKEDLAKAIVDEYTWFIPDLNCLAIKPGDGLPILTQDDLPYLNYQPSNDGCVVFSREYSDCYLPGDRYCYQVEIKLYENRWKISALSLNESVK